MSVTGCQDIPGSYPGWARKRTEPVPGPVLRLPPEPQRDHPERVDGSAQTGATRRVQAVCRAVQTFFSLPCSSSFPSEKPSSHPAGGGTKRSGAADHERGGQPEPGLAAQLPHPQHVQRGPGGHLHQGGRRQTLAGQRSVVAQLMRLVTWWPL